MGSTSSPVQTDGVAVKFLKLLPEEKRQVAADRGALEDEDIVITPPPDA